MGSTVPHDLVGRVFGLLTVEEIGQTAAWGRLTWWCRCVCGARKQVSAANLRSGGTKSCGCRGRKDWAPKAATTGKPSRSRAALRRAAKASIPNPNSPEEMIGLTSGSLTVVQADPKGERYWMCVCACGQTKAVRGDHIRNGKIRSCGCKSKNMAAATRGCAQRTHHPLYHRWYSMVQRCYLPSHTSYPRYGARGIRVCDRWRFGENGKEAFHCFLEDMGELPFPEASIDRINSKGDYEPNNCRWADHFQQARNTITSKLKERDVADIKRRLSLGESGSSLAREFGVNQSTVSCIQLGKTWANVAAATVS